MLRHMFGAMSAAENLPILLNAMPHDPALAMGAHRRQRMNRALERVKRVLGPIRCHGKRLVVIVPTNFADRHDKTSREHFIFPAAPAQNRITSS